MIKLTFDTNCIINLLDYKSGSAVSVDELAEIIRGYPLAGFVQTVKLYPLREPFSRTHRFAHARRTLGRRGIPPLDPAAIPLLGRTEFLAAITFFLALATTRPVRGQEVGTPLFDK